MPDWMQTLAKALPLHYLVDGTSAALTGTSGVGTAVATACAVLAGCAAVFGAVALKTFRWSDQS